MKVVDCFTFYNELNMLEFRLKYLYDVVDHFVLVESTVTHTGNPKPLYFQDNKARFSKYLDKIIHVVVDDMPVTDNAWTREKFQRNCIARGIAALTLEDDDILQMSDLDEIPNRSVLRTTLEDGTHALIQKMYYYNVMTRLTTGWDSARLLNYRTYRANPNPDTLRCSQYWYTRAIQNGGWHFSYFGDTTFIQNKIKNFAHQEFNSPTYTDLNAIETRVSAGVDLFGRDGVQFIRSYEPATLPEHHEMLM